MVFRPLPFASDDVELIHQALELRFGTSQRQRSGKPPE
jgi:hypothetical protein